MVASVYKLERTSRLRTLFHKSVANFRSSVIVWVCICTFVVNAHPPADFCQNDALFTSCSGMFCQSIGSRCCFFLAQYNTCAKFASLTPEVTFFASASYFSRSIEYASPQSVANFVSQVGCEVSGRV